MHGAPRNGSLDGGRGFYGCAKKYGQGGDDIVRASDYVAQAFKVSRNGLLVPAGVPRE